MNRARLIEELQRDEGIRLKPYLCTAGALTIGIGRNLDANGISIAEAQAMAHNDIDRCMAELDKALPWWRSLNDTRQRALVNMCFNLGISRLLQFKRTVKALEEARWDDAADAALESRWATQVGQRATRIARMLRNGS
jgi:lysozyme